MKTKENSPANHANPREYSPAETQRRREFPVGQASRLPSSQGRDGSPQTSLNSGANRRHPPSALPPPRLRASAGNLSDISHPPSALDRRAAAFTLLEVLVAVTVLSLMLTFMFSLLGSSLSLWETGNRRIEAAQVARVGLNIMASDLKNAFAGNMTSYNSSGNPLYSIAPFRAMGNTTTTTMGLTGGSVSSAGSQQLAGVLLTSNSTSPYNEFGYMSVFLDDPIGREPMIGDRYYLVKKLDDTASGNGGDFYFRNTAPNATWQNSSTAWYPIADNCIRLSFIYYGNETDPAGPPGWTPTWSPIDRLPLGVLATATVIDSRTAEKIASITTSPIPQGDIDAIFTTANPANTTQRLLRQGAVTVRRFIPFNRN